jgi:hypothetical protein
MVRRLSPEKLSPSAGQCLHLFDEGFCHKQISFDLAQCQRIGISSSYNQVVFVENPRFSTWYISVRRASAMDISEHQVLK